MVRYWRGRSTTTPNPYTINAEIYEVHHDSGRTWLPAITTTTTEKHNPEAQSTYAPDLQFGDFDQQQQQQSSSEVPLPTIPPTLPPLEYNEYQLQTGTEGYVHETADKHSTPPPATTTTKNLQLTTTIGHGGAIGVLNSQTQYTYPEAPINYDYAANDVIDRADQTLNYDDDTDWDIGNTNLVDGDAPGADPGRLSEYAKGISPSDTVANAHNVGYVKPVNIVNEHSQQRTEDGDGFVPFLESNSWRPSYIEIDRSTTLSPPNTDDIIYITEEDVALEKSPDTFSVPVGTSFSVPSTTVRQVTTTQAGEDETTPYHTTFRVDSTSRGRELEATSTAPEPEITTYARRIVVSTTGRQHDEEEEEVTSGPTPRAETEQTGTENDGGGGARSTTVAASTDGFVSTPAATTTTSTERRETESPLELSTVPQETATAEEAAAAAAETSSTTTTTDSSPQTSTRLEADADTTSTTEGEAGGAQPVADDVTTAKQTTTAAFEPTERAPERIRFRKTKPAAQPQPPQKKPGFLSGLLNFFLPSNKAPQRKNHEQQHPPVRRVDNVDEEEASSHPPPPSPPPPPTTFETRRTETPSTTTTEVHPTSSTTTTAFVTTSTTEKSDDTTWGNSYKVPKAIDTSIVKVNLPGSEAEEKEEAVRNEDIGAYTTPKSVLEDKLDAVVKKREQLIKNWTARKYNKGDKKSRYAAAATTTAAAVSGGGETTDSEAAETTTFLPFAPTVRPKSNRLPLKKNAKKISRKPPPPSILNYKKHLLKDSGIFSSPRKPEKKKKKKKASIPIGSRPDVYKKWGGGSLSQAEFESKVLGVSTATEVSVRSMICVRGRCFNAEDDEDGGGDQLR